MREIAKLDNPNEYWSTTDSGQYFSWYPCDRCHTTDGGDRHEAAICEAGKGIICDGLQICVDCLEEIS